MTKKSRNQAYVAKARKLKSEKLIKAIPKKLTRAQKANITRLYNKYAEVLEAEHGEFKRLYMSKKNAADYKKNGNLTNDRYVWVPLNGAGNAKIENGYLVRTYIDKIEFELLPSDFRAAISSDDSRAMINKRLKEIKKQYRNMGLVGSITGRFEGFTAWAKSYPDIQSLLNYIQSFTPHARSGANAKEMRAIKNELLSSLSIVIVEEMPRVR